MWQRFFLLTQTAGRWRIALWALALLLTAQMAWSAGDPWVVWANTLWLFLGTAALAIPLSLSSVIAVARLEAYGGRVALMIMLSVLLVPLYAQVGGWDAGWNLWHSLGTDYANAAGTLRSPVTLGLPAAIWVHSMAAIPWCLVFAVWGLAGLPRRAEEQLLLDRSNSWVLWNYTLPRLDTAIGAMAIWILVTTISEITVTDYYQVRTLSEELYLGFAVEPDLRSVLDRVLPGVAFIGIAAGWVMYAWLYAPLAPLVDRSSGIWSAAAAGDARYTTRSARSLAAVWIWLLAAIVVGLPLVWLIIQAGLERYRIESDAAHSWSMRVTFERSVAAVRDNRSELGLSLMISQLVAAASLLAAGPAAWWASRARRWPRLVLLAALAAAIATPAPITALGVIHLFDAPGRTWLNWLYDRTAVPLGLVHFVRCWPWAFLLLANAMKSIPASLADQSKLDGLSTAGAYWRWVFPATISQHLAAWFLVTGLSLGELSGSILVAPPGLMPFSVAFFSTLHYGARYELAALCLVVWSFAWLLATLGWLNGSGGWQTAGNGQSADPLY
jgi:ABC-type Fe3+ transport system permease subunit